MAPCLTARGDEPQRGKLQQHRAAGSHTADRPIPWVTTGWIHRLPAPPARSGRRTSGAPRLHGSPHRSLPRFDANPLQGNLTNQFTANYPPFIGGVDDREAIGVGMIALVGLPRGEGTILPLRGGRRHNWGAHQAGSSGTSAAASAAGRRTSPTVPTRSASAASASTGFPAAGLTPWPPPPPCRSG